MGVCSLAKEEEGRGPKCSSPPFPSLPKTILGWSQMLSGCPIMAAGPSPSPLPQDSFFFGGEFVKDDPFLKKLREVEHPSLTPFAPFLIFLPPLSAGGRSLISPPLLPPFVLSFACYSFFSLANKKRERGPLRNQTEKSKVAKGFAFPAAVLRARS